MKILHILHMLLMVIIPKLCQSIPANFLLLHSVILVDGSCTCTVVELAQYRLEDNYLYGFHSIFSGWHIGKTQERRKQMISWNMYWYKSYKLNGYLRRAQWTSIPVKSKTFGIYGGFFIVNTNPWTEKNGNGYAEKQAFLVWDDEIQQFTVKTKENCQDPMENSECLWVFDAGFVSKYVHYY